MSENLPVIPGTDLPAVESRKPSSNLDRELVKEIAMDIGKELVAYIEVMYPDAIKATSSTFKLSMRNHVYNDIMAALETVDADEIRARLERRRKFRRQWLKGYRDLRSSKGGEGMDKEMAS